jgi:hypothetical protein
LNKKGVGSIEHHVFEKWRSALLEFLCQRASVVVAAAAALAHPVSSASILQGLQRRTKLLLKEGLPA